MTRPSHHWFSRRTVVVLAVLVASACGSEATEPSSGVAPATDSRPVAIAGSELDGVGVDVRRDPG